MGVVGTENDAGRPRRVVDPRCPLRPDDPCTLCHPEATGPQDCMTVAIVMDDEDLRAELMRRRAERGATR
jgi:hypothetical protein